MIPKIIHYCWFGRGEKPELAMRCIESWREICPDYQIVEWNEDTFDIYSNLYVKEAYEAKKYAFVTDYVRLYAMYHQGGIYMDTDVRVLKQLDEFLEYQAFSGFESSEYVPTGIMASQQGDLTIKALLSYYTNRHFVKEDGSYDIRTNTSIITEYFLEKGLVQNNQFQVIDGFALYPNNYFCPELEKLEDEEYMKDTYTIHYFSGSWKSKAAIKRENSWWWKHLIVPLSRNSENIEKILGRPFVKFKKIVRDKMISEK